MHQLLQNNPNIATGGSGCIATGGRYHPDCEGPYHHWPLSTVWHPNSRECVLCDYHFNEALKSAQRARDEGRVMVAGRDDPDPQRKQKGRRRG